MNVKDVKDTLEIISEIVKKVGAPTFITIFILGIIIGGLGIHFYYSKQIEVSENQINYQKDNYQNETNTLKREIRAYEQTLNMKLFPHEITLRTLSHLKLKKQTLEFVNQLRELINNYDLKSRASFDKYVNLSRKTEDWDKKIEYSDEQGNAYLSLRDSLIHKYEKDFAMNAFSLRNELNSRREIMKLSKIRLIEENAYLHPNGSKIIEKICDQLEFMARRLPDSEIYSIPSIQ